MVAEYQSCFLALLNRADPLLNRQEQQMFTTGLNDDIRIDVELQGSRDLEHTCALARAYEKKTVCTVGATRTGYSRPPTKQDSSNTSAINRVRAAARHSPIVPGGDGGAPPPRPLLQL